eukprot:scaffold247354_cov24-Tisochrysis_lutea.AAC.1
MHVDEATYKLQPIKEFKRSPPIALCFPAGAAMPVPCGPFKNLNTATSKCVVHACRCGHVMCSHVLRDVDDSYEALTLDGELKIPDDLMAEIKVAQAKEERGGCLKMSTSCA